jgi:flagellin-like hook-associated protein FlgL
MSVSLTSGVRNALSSIQETSRMAEISQKRLATGKRVNSALDNPTNFFTASNLNSRASDLGNLLDSMSNAVKTIEAADNGIKTITKLVESAQSVVRQAKEANSGSAASATGSANVTAGASAGGAGDLVLRTGSGPAISFAVTASGAGSTVGELATAINSANIGVRADLVQNGANTNLKLTTTNGQSLTVDAASTAGNLTALGLTAGTTNPGASGDAARLTSLASQFNDLRTQIQRAARDAGFNGINLLNNQSLSVQFNETNTSNLNISAVDYGSATDPLNVSQIASGVFDTSSINAAESQLSAGLTRLRSDSSRLGSNLSTVQTRADFTRAMMKTLSEGADNLVLADQNEEGATLVTLNTRQQLATTALSLASQAQQNVLRLF